MPGIGPAAATALANEGVSNTIQLLGKVMMLREKEMDTQAHCDAVWFWLKECGVNAHRSGIVVCLMEKLETLVR